VPQTVEAPPRWPQVKNAALTHSSAQRGYPGGGASLERRGNADAAGAGDREADNERGSGSGEPADAAGERQRAAATTPSGAARSNRPVDGERPVVRADKRRHMMNHRSASWGKP
jgi:hypothetical protein